MPATRKFCACDAQASGAYAGDVVEMDPETTFIYTMSLFIDNPNIDTPFDATKPYNTRPDSNTQYLHTHCNGQTTSGTTSNFSTARQWSFVPKYDERAARGLSQLKDIASFTNINVQQCGTQYDISDNTWQTHKVTGTPWLQNFFKGDSAQTSIPGSSVSDFSKAQEGVNYAVQTKDAGPPFWYANGNETPSMMHKKPTGGCSFYSYKSLTYSEWLAKNGSFVAAKHREGGNDPRHHDNYLICIEPLLSGSGNTVEPEFNFEITYEFDIILGMQPHEFDQGGDIYRLSDGPGSMKNYPFLRMGEQPVASLSLTDAVNQTNVFPMW
jgi:hypothetical protein